MINVEFNYAFKNFICRKCGGKITWDLVEDQEGPLPVSQRFEAYCCGVQYRLHPTQAILREEEY